MTGLDVVAALIGVAVLAAAVLAVTGRQVVHAALWLVVALGGLAPVYVVLGAEVIALVQVLVYVGAVVVLVLFALMVTRAPIGPDADLDAPRGRRALAALAGAAVTGGLGWALLSAAGGRTLDRAVADGRPRPLGEALFGAWVLPFELLSVLLLAALVAALALAAVRRGRP